MDPFKLFEKSDFIAAVNTHGWHSIPEYLPNGKRDQRWKEGKLVNIYNWLMDDGKQISPSEVGFYALWIDKHNKPHIGNPDHLNPPVVQIGIGSVYSFPLLIDGTVMVTPDVVKDPRAHPRTAGGIHERDWMFKRNKF